MLSPCPPVLVGARAAGRRARSGGSALRGGARSPAPPAGSGRGGSSPVPPPARPPAAGVTPWLGAAGRQRGSKKSGENTRNKDRGWGNTNVNLPWFPPIISPLLPGLQLVAALCCASGQWGHGHNLRPCPVSSAPSAGEGLGWCKPCSVTPLPVRPPQTLPLPQT